MLYLPGWTKFIFELKEDKACHLGDEIKSKQLLTMSNLAPKYFKSSFAKTLVLFQFKYEFKLKSWSEIGYKFRKACTAHP